MSGKSTRTILNIRFTVIGKLFICPAEMVEEPFTEVAAVIVPLGNRETLQLYT